MHRRKNVGMPYQWTKSDFLNANFLAPILGRLCPALVDPLSGTGYRFVAVHDFRREQCLQPPQNPTLLPTSSRKRKELPPPNYRFFHNGISANFARTSNYGDHPTILFFAETSGRSLLLLVLQNLLEHFIPERTKRWQSYSFIFYPP